MRSIKVFAIGLVFAAVWCGAGPPPRQSSAEPDGWADYIRAAKLLQDNASDVYLAAIENNGASIGQTEAGADRDRLRAELQEQDYLGARTVATAKYRDALAAVVEGNSRSKLVAPEASSVWKVYPMLLRIARLFVAQSYTRAAAGDAAGSVQSNLEALRLFDRLSGVTVIGNMYGTTADNDVYRRLTEELPTLSLRELTSIQTFVASELSQPSSVEQLLQKGRQLFDAHVAGMKTQLPLLSAMSKDAQKQAAKSTGLPIGVVDRVAGTGKNDLESLSRQLADLGHEEYDQMLKAIRGPESDWWPATAQWPRKQPQADVGAGAGMDAVAQALLGYMRFPIRTVVDIELVRRAQLRLLWLNCGVMAYKWHHHRLPAHLSDFAPEAAGFDPLSAEPFVYRLEPGGGFEISSKGRPDTGAVDLDYKGLPSGQISSPP